MSDLTDAERSTLEGIEATVMPPPNATPFIHPNVHYCRYLGGAEEILATHAALEEWARRWPCSILKRARLVRIRLASNGDLTYLYSDCRGMPDARRHEEIPADELCAFIDDVRAAARDNFCAALANF